MVAVVKLAMKAESKYQEVVRKPHERDFNPTISGITAGPEVKMIPTRENPPSTRGWYMYIVDSTPCVTYH